MLTLRKIAARALLLALLAAFATGIAHLCALRFRAGDIYPPSSSLRADPLGGKALYDSLGALPGVRTSRNFQALDRIDADQETTMFYTGVPVSSAWETHDLDQIDKLLGHGLRLVMTFAPVTEKKEAKKPKADPLPKKKKEKSDEEIASKVLDASEFAKRLGFTFRSLDLAEDQIPRLNADRKLGNTEPRIAWRSFTFFDQLQPSWRVVYACQNQPVVIEKNVGAGSLVLCADSYFVSNEALRKDRAPTLLAWLGGGRPRIIFDELHHGISERPGVATLARKYRLQSFAGVLVLLAALFVWQNAVPLVPARVAADETETLAGRDSFAGFVNLLRRNVSPVELIRVCWAEWRQAFSHQSRLPKESVAHAASIAADTPANQAVTAFRELQQLLARKK